MIWTTKNKVIGCKKLLSNNIELCNQNLEVGDTFFENLGKILANDPFVRRAAPEDGKHLAPEAPERVFRCKMGLFLAALENTGSFRCAVRVVDVLGG